MINLLPQQVKKNLRLEELNRHIMFFGEVVFMMLLVLSFLMFSQELFGRWKIRELMRRITAVSALPQAAETAQFRKQLRLFKNDIDRMGRIQEQQLRVLGSIADLGALLPPAIQLTALDIDMVSHKIIFSGIAPTRGGLLLLKEKIQKESSRYGDVNFPLANLLRETDIPFTLSLSIIPPPH